MLKNSKPSTRVFIGKIGALTQREIRKECAKHGNILDFLLKDQYAFVVIFWQFDLPSGL